MQKVILVKRVSCAAILSLVVKPLKKPLDALRRVPGRARLRGEGAVVAGRVGARAVDLGTPSVYQGGQSLKLSTKAAVLERVSLLIGGPSTSIGGARLPLGAGPGPGVPR